jgi:hypothetical protein
MRPFCCFAESLEMVNDLDVDEDAERHAVAGWD